MKTQSIIDRGILFEAFLAKTDRSAGQHLGSITAFAPGAAQTAYSKMNEKGDTVLFEADNFIDTVGLTVQFKAGAAVPEVNEEILLVPTSVFDREWSGIYKLTAKPIPTQAQQGVRTVSVTAQRAVNGKTQVPVQPARFQVESYADGSGGKIYTLRNIGGTKAESGDDYLIVNPDRLLAVAGYDFPAAVDSAEMLYTPAADVDADGTVEVEMVAETP